MTESELLGEVCDSFGGTQRLADAIGITRRPVLRWNAGEPVPLGIWEKIEVALGQRVADYQRLRELVRDARVKAGDRAYLSPTLAALTDGDDQR